MVAPVILPVWQRRRKRLSIISYTTVHCRNFMRIRLKKTERFFNPWLAIIILLGFLVLDIGLTRVLDKPSSLPPSSNGVKKTVSRRRSKSGFYRKWGKRGLDIAVSAAAILLLSPLFLIVALLVRLKLGHPVFFSQERPGIQGRPFTLYKFRSMTDQRDASGSLLPDAQRLTRFGKLLRGTSLDELPELFNVLKGDMSIVGPRPLIMAYLSRYTPEQARRHEVLPGITGWAQINGRNAISWEKRFELDIWYIDNCSWQIDLKILALTCWKVIKREGISEAGHQTMSEFMGTRNQ
jgi:sugar transferase EpsL